MWICADRRRRQTSFHSPVPPTQFTPLQGALLSGARGGDFGGGISIIDRVGRASNTNVRNESGLIECSLCERILVATCTTWSKSSCWLAAFNRKFFLLLLLWRVPPPLIIPIKNAQVSSCSSKSGEIFFFLYRVWEISVFHCFNVLLYYYRAIDVLHKISDISFNNMFSNVFAMAFILQLPVVFFFFATMRKDFQSCYSFTFQKANPTFPPFSHDFIQPVLLREAPKPVWSFLYIWRLLIAVGEITLTPA